MVDEQDPLEGNLALIKRRWPEVGQLIEQASLPASIAVDETGSEPTLVVDGLHLTSMYDRLREAELQASLIPEQSSEAWVYGLGLAILPQLLLTRSSLQRLNVVIFNREVARVVCQFFDQTGWLADPRVRLLFYDQQSDVRFPFAAVPPCLQLAEDEALRLKDLVLLALATPHIQKRHEENAEAYRQRLMENEPFIAQDADVKNLFGTCSGRPIIVAGAGPTLAQHYDDLRRHRDDHCLIAVDGALKPLVEAGIQPDIVVTQDPTEIETLPYFSKISLGAFSETPLVYFPLVPTSVLQLWPGPRLTAYTDHPRYRELAQRYPKGELFSSGSVFHPAVDLAVRMGGNPVIFAGADFSFPGNKKHVAGASTEVQRLKVTGQDWLFNGYGEKVETLPNLRGYMRDLETYITTRPQVTFVNGSKDGARIEGTIYLEGDRS